MTSAEVSDRPADLTPRQARIAALLVPYAAAWPMAPATKEEPAAPPCPA